jgi:hypothetical protein
MEELAEANRGALLEDRQCEWLRDLLRILVEDLHEPVSGPLRGHVADHLDDHVSPGHVHGHQNAPLGGRKMRQLRQLMCL